VPLSVAASSLGLPKTGVNRIITLSGNIPSDKKDVQSKEVSRNFGLR
jgi:hypothetical protein